MNLRYCFTFDAIYCKYQRQIMGNYIEDDVFYKMKDLVTL